MRFLRYDRCANCPDHSKKIVVGEGPEDATVMFVGEAPGKMEADIGRPFVGKTGIELDQTYLPLAGLSRREIFISNTTCCHWADASDAPPPDVVASCSQLHLKYELETVRPQFLVLMGGISNGLLGLDIDRVQGSSRHAKLWGWEGTVYSTYHPALGIHIPARMQNLLDSFTKLRKVLRQEIPLTQNEYPNPQFYRLREPEHVDMLLDGLYDLDLAIDTESKKSWKGYRPTIRYTPYSIQFAFGPDEGFLIMVSDKAAVARFGHHARKFRRILMHNAPHDWRILSQLEIDLEFPRIQDTMSMAYVDARLPKGLKNLSYQLLGSDMNNFDDLVIPYGKEAAMRYFQKASGIEWSTPEQQGTGEFVEKKCPACKGTSVVGTGRGKARKVTACKECEFGFVTVEKTTRKQGMGPKIKRLMTDYDKNPESVDPWQRWENWEGGVQELIDTIGPVPLASIELVPEARILDYAVTDAINTWRVAPILRERHREIRKKVRA